MPKIRLERRRSSGVVLQLFGALGLVVAAGCGSSDNNNSRKDSGGGTGSGDGGGMDVGVRKDAPPATGEVQQPIDTRLGPDSAIDGPTVVIDAPKLDVPVALDGGLDGQATKLDVGTINVDSGSTGGSTGEGTGGAGGGAGGSTGVGTGGSTGTVQGGATGAGGTTAEGGATGTGGATAPGTGGTTGEGTGGVDAAAAGGAAGAATGGSATGGAIGTGGATSTGGAVGTGGATSNGGSTGISSPGVITGWPTAEDDAPHHVFAATCNGSAQAAPASWDIVLTNAGNTVAAITEISLTGTGFTVSPSSALNLNRMPGGTFTFTVAAPAIAYPTTPGDRTATLVITTNEATNNVHTIRLVERVNGTVLAWGDGARESSYQLEGVSPGNTSSHAFKLTNTGEAVSVNLTLTPSDSEVFGFPEQVTTGITMSASETIDRTLVFTGPTNSRSNTTQVGVTLASANHLCAPLPTSWTANAISEYGYPEVTIPPSPYSFENNTLRFSAACGSTPANQLITVRNVGTDGLNWGGDLTDNTAFTVTASSATNPLAIDGSVLFTLSQSAFSSTEAAVRTAKANLTLTSAAGSYDRTYDLEAYPLGDRIAFTGVTIGFGEDIPLNVASTTPPSGIFTVSNNGFADPLEDGTEGTNAHVALTLLGSGYVSFEPDSQVTTKNITVAAKGQTLVSVHYLRPNLGPIGSDSAYISWSIADERNCGDSEGTVGAITGSVVVGQVGHRFDDLRSNFGTVFCGATGAARTYLIENTGSNGAGNFHVTGYSLGSGTYFTVTPPRPCTPPAPGHHAQNCTNYCDPTTRLCYLDPLAPEASVSFTVSPKMIPPGDIASAADLGAGSNKFTDTLTIYTDAPELDSNGQPTGSSVTITQPLQMWAQGVLINPSAPVSNLTWNYGTINWPTKKYGSDTEWVDNQGNANGVASIATSSSKLQLLPIVPDVLPMVTPTATNVGNAKAALSSEYGLLSECSTTDGNFTYTGTLSVVADLRGVTNQDLTTNGGLVGICQTGSQVQPTTNCRGPGSCAAWVQPLTFTGAVAITGSLCGATQCCGSNGACTSGTANNSCGTGDNACVNCSSPSFTGVCLEGGTCGCGGSTPDLCPSACVNFLNDNANCGSCGHACEGEQVCQTGVCESPPDH